MTTTEIETTKAETAPLVTPEIPTVETEFDRIKARRLEFAAALRENAARQIKGKLSTAIGVCFVGLGNELLLK